MRKRFRPSHGTVVAYVALFVALGGTTYAATGGNFILGQANTASSTTSLARTGANTAKGLQVTNTSTGTGATALGLSVASGHAPFTTNSGTKVTNLNADKLDGVDSIGFKSNAYIDRQDSIQALNASGATQVASKSLPAGSFVLMAKLLADNDASSAARIDCSLNDPAANQLDFMKLRLAPTSTPNLEFGNISLAGAVTLGVPGTITVQCTQLEDFPPPGITVGFRKLIAIKIDTLHP
jgi:hypothetical protein